MPALISFVTTFGFGEELEMSGGGYSDALVALEVRNLIVYNRSVVDDRFITQTGRQDLQVGSLYPVETKDVLLWIDAVADVAAFIDLSFAKRFDLPVGPLFPPEVEPS